MSIDTLFGGQPPAPSPGQHPAQPQPQPGPAQGMTMPQGPPGYGGQPALPPPGYAPQQAPGFPAPAPVQQGQFAQQPPQGYAPQQAPGFAAQPGYGQQAQPQANPAWADAIMGATASSSGAPYLKAGTYVLDIIRVKAVPKRDNPSITVFIIEGKIIESTSPDAMVGTERSISRSIPGNNGQGANDVRAWLEAIVGGAAAAKGHPAPAFSTQWLHDIAGPNQPFAGQRIKITAWDQEMKTVPGKFFTKVRVEYLPPGTALGLQTQAPAPQAAPDPQPGQFAQQPPQGYAPPQQALPGQGYAPAPGQYQPPVPGQQPQAPTQVQYPAQPPAGWPAGAPYPPQG